MLQGSEDSSEYTTDDDSESDHGHVLLKPAFVPKVEREVRTQCWVCCPCRVAHASKSAVNTCNVTCARPRTHPVVFVQTLAEREAALVEAEQTTRQPAEQLEERRRQTQELVAQAQQQDVQQVRYSVCSSSSGHAVVACAHMLGMHTRLACTWFAWLC